jgi:hypothetical protein
MADAVKECLLELEVVIKRESSSEASEKGDEIKLTINIKAKLNKIRPKCLNIVEVSSAANYSFYPRKLLNFALIKNRDLDASLPIDFYGPVYVENDIILPSEKGLVKAVPLMPMWY